VPFGAAGCDEDQSRKKGEDADEWGWGRGWAASNVTEKAMFFRCFERCKETSPDKDSPGEKSSPMEGMIPETRVRTKKIERLNLAGMFLVEREVHCAERGGGDGKGLPEKKGRVARGGQGEMKLFALSLSEFLVAPRFDGAVITWEEAPL